MEKISKAVRDRFAIQPFIPFSIFSTQLEAAIKWIIKTPLMIPSYTLRVLKPLFIFYTFFLIKLLYLPDLLRNL